VTARVEEIMGYNLAGPGPVPAPPGEAANV